MKSMLRINIMVGKKRLLWLLLLIAPTCSYAMNLLWPHDTLIRPWYTPEKRFGFYLYGEHGFDMKSYNSSGCSVNIMNVWQNEQNALKALEGCPADSKAGQLRIKLGANDDGVRGHFCVSGDMDIDGGALYTRFSFHNDWFVNIYLPFYRMKLKNVVWQDKTLAVDQQDFIVKSCLTDDFLNVICEVSGLHLGGWTRTGVGDLTFLLQWLRDFEQPKEFLRNVRLNWRVGTNIPTGLRKDEDKILALPFGYDGAVGLRFGFSLDALLGEHFQTGFDVELHHLFGNTRERRIKSQRDQTDLLFLKKTCVYKDFGLTQKFNLYFQLQAGGFATRVGYQFLKRGGDFLYIAGQDASDEIANTAISLFDWTAHQIFVNAYYTPNWDKDDERVKPYVSLFARMPFNGKRTILQRTVGVAVGVEF